MRTLVSFFLLMLVKIFSHIFYRLEVNWLSEIKKDFSDIRLIIFLNHTSLYEPLFVQVAPSSFLYQMAQKMVAPAADVTMNRPIVGIFWKLIGPRFISITRKRDKSWFKFMKMIENKYVVMILPEGRMKRKTGLDKHGKPMSIRSGVAEILQEINEGRVMVAYSGGLHHVQHPGQLLPRLFQTIKLNLEILDIQEYKNTFSHKEGIPFRKEVVADLESRLKSNCPTN